MSHLTIRLAALFTLALCGATAAQQPLSRHEFTRVEMGVKFKLILYAVDKDAASTAAQRAFDRVRRLNSILSDYDQNSELSRLSATAGGGRAVKISPELRLVLSRSQALSRRSDGAFDVTIGPVVRLWRRARRMKKLPSPQRLAAAKKAVGYQFLKLNEQDRTATLLQPGMRLDLGGIAKGYAADQALADLRKCGVPRALVDGGGDIALGDPPPGRDAWRVGVAPLKAGAPPSRFLFLKNQAVATSGDAHQFVEIDGRRYSHIVDPKTGLGLTGRGSVTIVAKDCMTADSLASAVSVLGPEKGIRLAEETKAAALVMRKLDGKLQFHESKSWKALPVR